MFVLAEDPPLSGIIITVLLLVLAIAPTRSWRAVAPGIDGGVITIARVIAVVTALLGISAMVVLNTVPVR